jgi:hypothetical protein
LQFLEKNPANSGGEERNFLSDNFVHLEKQEGGLFTNILESSGEQESRIFSVNHFSSGGKRDRFMRIPLFVWRTGRRFIDCHPLLSLEHDWVSWMTP